MKTYKLPYPIQINDMDSTYISEEMLKELQSFIEKEIGDRLSFYDIVDRVDRVWFDEKGIKEIIIRGYRVKRGEK